MIENDFIIDSYSYWDLQQRLIVKKQLSNDVKRSWVTGDQKSYSSQIFDGTLTLLH